jgi:hypothetical protein
MDDPDEVGEYSAYVTTAAEDFYENSPAGLAQPGDSGMPEFTNPADGIAYPLLPATDDDVAQAGPNTYLPGPVGLPQEEWPQLRSRGIYPDYMTNEVAGKIATCVPLDFEGNPPDGCQIPHFLDPLEVYPFFEVQVTKLANWIEDPIGMPVKVTNLKIASGNTHSRGKAVLEEIGMGKTKANHAIHKGNNGIAATSSIRPTGVVDPQAADITTGFVHIDTTDDGSEPPAGFNISGDIAIGVPGNLSISNMDLTDNVAECGITTTGYECIIPVLSANSTMTLSGYEQNKKIRYACSDQLFELAQSTDDSNSWTTFDLSGTVPATAHIVIQNTPCADLP